MGDETEDKPKIDLTINYDAQGQSQHTFSLLLLLYIIRTSCVGSMVFVAACTVKVKPTTPLKKVFEAAEVRISEPGTTS